MAKMATMPIYGKNLKKSSSPEPLGWLPWNLVCSIKWLSTFEWREGETLHTSKTIVLCDMKEGASCTSVNTKGQGHSITCPTVTRIECL